MKKQKLSVFSSLFRGSFWRKPNYFVLDHRQIRVSAVSAILRQALAR
jgi:hypothetical protein